MVFVDDCSLALYDRGEQHLMAAVRLVGDVGEATPSVGVPVCLGFSRRDKNHDLVFHRTAVAVQEGGL